MEHRETLAPPPYPLPPPARPSGLVIYPRPLPVGHMGGHSHAFQWPNLMVPPPHRYRPHFQYRSQPWQHPQYAATVNHPAAAAAATAVPPHVSGPVWRPPEGGNSRPVGFVNGELVYELAPPLSTAAPPPPNIKKRKLAADGQQEPYIKKPPNAFLVFCKEQRPSVVAHCKVSNNAVVNGILGRRWAALTPEERAPYFEEAEAARRLHRQQHPQWSSRDNYGQKRKRRRYKAAHSVIESASKPNEVTELPGEGPSSLLQPAATVDPSLCHLASFETGPASSEIGPAPSFGPAEATVQPAQLISEEEEFLLEEALVHSLETQSPRSPTEEEEELLRNLWLLLDSS